MSRGIDRHSREYVRSSDNSRVDSARTLFHEHVD
jgi:hypothetical protein